MRLGDAVTRYTVAAGQAFEVFGDVLGVVDPSGQTVAARVASGRGGATDIAFMLLGGVKASQLHHIASNKSIASGFTKAYEAIFARGGMTLKEAANIMRLPGHSGPHSVAYKQYVLDKLQAATKGLRGKDEIKKATQETLKMLRKELEKNPDLIRKKN